VIAQEIDLQVIERIDIGKAVLDGTGEQGIVNLHFRVARDGRVLRYDIRKSSGHSLLDDEAEAMLQRAQPLPKFPDDMPGGYLDVVVPVLFSLRGNN
tara:strand:- start:76122 stop:76412 length:291 start_codon:yes stop_codon:yes gene_type:complete